MDFFGKIFIYSSEIVMLESIYNEGSNCEIVKYFCIDFNIVF